MRINLIAILFIGFLMQVSANSLAQKVTLNYKEASLKDVFNELKKQTGYKFLYTKEMLSESRKVTIKTNDVPLRDALTDIFSKQPLSFSIEDNSVVLKRKQVSIMEKISTFLKLDSILFKGKVLDEKGDPLPGATIKLKGGNKASVSTETGYFERYGTAKGTMVISYLGYLTKEISLEGRNPNQLIMVRLSPGLNQLGEVNVVGTGYQEIPKERATGSFEVITKEQLQHSTSPNLLRRLEGITTSLDFRNDLTKTNSVTSGVTNPTPLLSQLTIRGKNTLNRAEFSDNTSGFPLVVIDGIPSVDPLDIERFNPEDVENITILKDAAAASIWGSRAANGVIVIKTKTGGLNRATRLSFNSNVEISEKMNLFYKKLMSTSEFIDAEKSVFNQRYPIDYYPTGTSPLGDIDVMNPQPLASPVFEILNSQRNGSLTESQANAQIDALRGNDVRNDLTKYILRDAVTQNYNLGVDGGSAKVSYRLSAGYNHAIANTVGAGTNRVNLNFNTSAKPVKNLTLTVSANYVKQNAEAQANKNKIGNPDGAIFNPYTRLADNQGNPVVVPILYRPGFLDALENKYGNSILSLRWKPLEDINDGYQKSTAYSLTLNSTAAYQIIPSLSANVTYSYNKGWTSTSELNRQNSFYMRNLIDFYTDPVDQRIHNVPLGGLYEPKSNESENQTFRGLLNFNKSWNDKHDISAIVGVDVAQSKETTRTDRYYRYNEDKLTTQPPINYVQVATLFNDQYGSPTSGIPYLPVGYAKTMSRTYSLFSNIAYTYNKRYTLSTSIRKDASSAFGTGTNRTGTPYYHVGGSWNINNEDFYNISWLPSLKLRITYGYNGNVNPAVTANPSIGYVQNPGINQLPYANLNPFNLTNRNLRPERTGVLNFGLDFGTKNSRLSGSVDYYDKQTKDLLVSNPSDPTLGSDHLISNAGNLSGHGVDIILNSQNLQSGLFSWNSSFLFSYNRVKITKLYSPQPQTAGYAVGNSNTFYTEGYELNRVFVYKWAGLDPQTGDPRIYLNGEPVTVNGADQAVLDRINNAPLSELRYIGSGIPVYYGSLRNSFNYGSLSLSFNLLYKLGYWQMKNFNQLANYALLFPSYGSMQPIGAEYANRWQKPGDELHTNVPSVVYGDVNFNRSPFYQNADINAYKADHIRLQEINLSYTFRKTNWFLKNPRIYANVSNVGVIWRANKFGIDPDINDYPIPRSYSLGFSANF